MLFKEIVDIDCQIGTNIAKYKIKEILKEIKYSLFKIFKTVSLKITDIPSFQ